MLTEKTKEILNTADAKMKDAIAFLEESLKNYRVGKANPAVFNKVLVNYYGTPTPIPQVASVTSPDAKTLAIQPWERSLIPAIEKAIIDSNIGLTPSNNGETIRCSVPALTEERRKELVKSGRGSEAHRQESKGNRCSRSCKREGYSRCVAEVFAIRFFLITFATPLFWRDRKFFSINPLRSDNGHTQLQDSIAQ